MHTIAHKSCAGVRKRRREAEGIERATMSRFDIVVYGATGFTGAYIVKALATSPLFADKSIAVAGRSKSKLSTALAEIAQETGECVPDVSKYPIIIADSSDEESLGAMARQAKVIINAVGPYVLYGEAVVRAAIENGADHLDISGEEVFLEHKYNEAAKAKGVYIVGACGFDSVPCDFGTEFLKRDYEGNLAYVETFMRLNKGSVGYPLNTGTYNSILLAIASLWNFNAWVVKRAIAPKNAPKAKYSPPLRLPITHQQHPALDAWCIPFVGSDKSIVDRSQYDDFATNGKRPVQIATYMVQGSFIKSVLALLWLGFIGFFALFSPTRKLLEEHPELFSFGMFQNAGPSKEQIDAASFDYFVFGTGWEEGEEANGREPTKKAAIVCRSADPGYVATSACISSIALALLNDRPQLAKDGGVFTPVSAVRDTRIFAYLQKMGVNFERI
ncbi:hypothetical protein PRIPAC_77947 [Pristionchus pacificus]|uniref:Sacchrp_dh_NADP domain-containing protein n=1 Tax=Pristionchus pacificus TaxID=54126 RepID=A0A2A6C3X2_PRIPA|nr:hypothetical protein PRIPAC_77947 [Pristionchus pacificus]|eukprot:PDM72798.1 hypothetical protein PRIPAC_39232 [Pristionchus pacificus]